MAEPRDVDWAAIRLEWETSSKSDQAIADQYGFRSATTILRARKQGAWHRTKAVEQASRVARAVKDTPLDPRATADVCVRPDAHTHAELQQIRASAAQNGLGVCEVSGDGADRAAAGQPAGGTSVAHIHTKAGTAVADTREQSAARYMRDLDLIRVEAIKRQLAMADRLRTTGEKILYAVDVLFCHPHERVSVDHLWAHQALRSVNPDKDTITGVTKSAAGMLQIAGEMERKALGMEGGARRSEDAGDKPAVGVRPEDVLPLLSQLSLEEWSIAAHKVTLMRPTLEGRAEPLGSR